MFHKILETRVDLEQVQREVTQLIAEVSVPSATRSLDQLSAIGLTYRTGATNLYEDANESQFDSEGNKRYSEAEFENLIPLLSGTYLETLHRELPLHIGRMRIMLMRPYKVYQMHNDSTMRAHLAIETNPHCYLFAPGCDPVHVPADGSIHVLDTRRPHTALNAGDRDRLHLTISLADTEV